MSAAASESSSGRFLIRGSDFEIVELRSYEPRELKISPSRRQAKAIRRNLGSSTAIVGTDGMPTSMNVGMSAEELVTFEAGLRPIVDKLIAEQRKLLREVDRA